MDLLEVASQRLIPGVLIFNHRQEPVFFNPVALSILSKLNADPSASVSVTIPKAILNLYDNLRKNFLSSHNNPHEQIAPQIALFSTQDATYCCRGFFLESDSGSSGKNFHIMMLIERVLPHRQIDLEKLKKRFQLTNRQIEIVKHLFAGLMNKEIANTLCVSEDTIKGHLKHIMRRLQVHSRTELLSMILQL